MASRYWVGGTGTWDDTATTHWATASGAAGGASVPTSSDDVFFDGSSGGGTVTINYTGGAVCGALNFTGYTGTVSSTSNTFVKGNLTLGAGGTFTSFFCQMTPPLVTTTTVTFNGKTMSALDVSAQGAGTGGVQFVDAANISATMTLTKGTLDTNGKGVQWGRFVSANTNSRTLTMGASTISIFWASGTGWDCSTSTSMTITANTATINFSGASVVVHMSGSALSFNGASLVFNSTGSSTLNGTTIQALTIVNVSLTLTLGGDLTVLGAVTLTSGTLDTNGKTCSWGTFVSSNTNTRVLTLGASTINITTVGAGSFAWSVQTQTNMTLNAGTSTINFNGTNGPQIMAAGSFSYYNVKRIPSAGTGIDEFALSSDLTCTGTFTVTSDTARTHRVIVKGITTSSNSNSVGVPRTITAAATSLTDVDFSDIVAAGAASPFVAAAGDLADALGNSNITFTTPVTRYGVVAGSWSVAATWSASSGGAGGASPPLCHDNVVLDANSAAGTYAVNVFRAGKNLTCTGFTRTVSGGGTAGWGGSVLLVAGMTWTMTGTNNFYGRGAETLTSAGKSFGGVVAFYAVNGSYTLQDDLTTTGGSVRHLSGTLNLNGKTVTCPSFINQVPAATPPVVDFGGGLMVLNGTGTVWNVNQTMSTIGGGIVDITDTTSTAKTVSTNGNTHGFTLRHIATGTAGLTISGSGTFGGMVLTCSSVRTITLPGPATTTINGPTILTGGSAGNELTLVSSSPGSAANVKMQGGANRVNGADLLPSADIKFKPPSLGLFGASLVAH